MKAKSVHCIALLVVGFVGCGPPLSEPDGGDDTTQPKPLTSACENPSQVIPPKFELECDDSKTLFEHTFTREKGQKNEEAVDFSTASSFVCVRIESSGVASANLALNGQKIIEPKDLNAHEKSFTRMLRLDPKRNHTLSALLTGKPKEQLDVKVFGAKPTSVENSVTSFTVENGKATCVDLCGGASSLSFSAGALPAGVSEKEFEVVCDWSAMSPEDRSPKLVFSPDFVFADPPVLDHFNFSEPHERVHRLLDGEELSTQVVATEQMDGSSIVLRRSLIPHFSTSRDVDLGGWCQSRLGELGASESHLCYSHDGFEFLIGCYNSSSVVLDYCGSGGGACIKPNNDDDYCDTVPADKCKTLAENAPMFTPCPLFPDTEPEALVNKLRCSTSTNMIFVGTGEACEFKGGNHLTRAQQGKVVGVAAYGAAFEDAAREAVVDVFGIGSCFLFNIEKFDDYSEWSDPLTYWASDMLKFLVCEEIYKGKTDGNKLLLEPQSRVTSAETAALFTRMASLGDLESDGERLEPLSVFSDLHEHYEKLKDGTTAPKVDIDFDPRCPEDAWFREEQPVLQAVMDFGVACEINAINPMLRATTADWLYRLTNKHARPACTEGYKVTCSKPEPLVNPTLLLVEDSNNAAFDRGWRVKNHVAQDYPAYPGNFVVAVADGVVSRATSAGGFGDCCGGPGQYVVMEHRKADGSVFYTLSGHMSPLVEEGDRVRAGQKIGEITSYYCDLRFTNNPSLCSSVGDMTQEDDWSHLHFSVWDSSDPFPNSGLGYGTVREFVDPNLFIANTKYLPFPWYD